LEILFYRWGGPAALGRAQSDPGYRRIASYRPGGFIRLLLGQFPPRIVKAEEFALRHRVLLLRSDTGIGIDISLGITGYEGLVMQRATPYTYLPRLKLLTCSAEDLVILKAFADRSRDWSDVEGIVARQEENLDWKYIKKHLTVLVKLKEAPQILEKLNRVRRGRF